VRAIPERRDRAAPSAPSTLRSDSGVIVSVLYVALAIHVAISLGLIFLVLLHSGRGGGLSDMFGGGLGTTAAGSTVVEKNLDRMTVVCSVIFVFTTMALALLLDQA